MGVILADIQLVSKCNKGIRCFFVFFLLICYYIYSKYIWVIPLEGKKCVTIQFNNIILVPEQENSAATIVNAYIIYDLDYWLKDLFNNFVLKIACFARLI